MLCWHKRVEVIEEWRRLHIEELNDIYTLIRYYSRHVESRGAEVNTMFCWGNVTERHNLKNVEVG